MGTTTKSKLERVKARLSEAVRDVRENGRQGRSVAEIAGQFRCKPGTLKVKLSEAGLLGPLTPALELAKARRIEKQAEASNGSDSLVIKGLDVASLNSRGDEGKGGGNPLRDQTSLSVGVGTDEDRLKGLTSEVRRVIESSIRAGAKVLKCETPTDLERLFKLYRETFKPLDGESSGPGRGLIQVQILGDASAPAPRQVRVIEAQSSLISESPSDSVPVSLPSEAGQREG